ncbi:MAG: type IV-A pilus assembly ATPase PilB [bacterium]
MSSRLGEMLVKANLITQEQLNHALEEQKKTGGRLGYNLIRLNYLKEEDLTVFLSKQYGVSSVNLASFTIAESTIKLVPFELAKRYMVIPLNRIGTTLTLAMADPSNIFALDDIKFMTGYCVEPVVAPESAVREAIKRYYGGGGGGGGGSGSGIGEEQKALASIDAKDYTFDDNISEGELDNRFEEEPLIDVEDFDSVVKGAIDNIEVVEDDQEDRGITAEDAPIVKLVNGVLIRAIKMGVSDIHIEPYEKNFRIRYRLDGVLRNVMSLPLKVKNAIASRLKIMAKLDIAERRLPQDGRIKLKLGKTKNMDYRVSVLPTLFGEKIVLRLLDKANLQLDMTKLGFESKALNDFQEAIHKPYGMVLVTGPTGSGKTTTLYSALSQLNDNETNLMTAEDPVEFNLAGINQVQIKEQIGLTFAAALRSFLRQDPDIIMVGEIRDYETAEIAVKAALTGHLVLSTLHTNDTAQTINRLLNMGVEAFLVASAVVLILAQRLARKICDQCKEEVEVPKEALLKLGFLSQEIKDLKVYKGHGCMNCANTGYRGRIALYEVMTLTEQVKELVIKGGTANEIKEAARKDGMMSLRDSGLQKVKEGVTTLEEVLKVTFGD